MEGFLGEYVPSAVRHCASSTAAAVAFPTATRTGARPRPSQPDFLYMCRNPVGKHVTTAPRARTHARCTAHTRHHHQDDDDDDRDDYVDRNGQRYGANKRTARAHARRCGRLLWWSRPGCRKVADERTAVVTLHGIRFRGARQVRGARKTDTVATPPAARNDGESVRSENACTTNTTAAACDRLHGRCASTVPYDACTQAGVRWCDDSEKKYLDNTPQDDARLNTSIIYVSTRADNRKRETV